MKTEIPDLTCIYRIVAELDGNMIPIVTTDSIPSGDQPIDRRKTRKLGWKETLLISSPSFALTVFFFVVYY